MMLQLTRSSSNTSLSTYSSGPSRLKGRVTTYGINANHRRLAKNLRRLRRAKIIQGSIRHLQVPPFYSCTTFELEGGKHTIERVKSFIHNGEPTDFRGAR